MKKPFKYHEPMKKLIKVSAEWCTNCKPIAKILEENDFGIPIESYDLDNDFEFLKHKNIRGVPTLILMDGDEELRRLTGLKSATQIQEFIGN